jgi:hypothetical protein
MRVVYFNKPHALFHAQMFCEKFIHHFAPDVHSMLHCSLRIQHKIRLTHFTLNFVEFLSVI